MLTESCTLLSLLLTKCPSCKIMQSFSSVMRSLSQMSDEYCCAGLDKYNEDIISL
jgi:hypothetical protein